MMTDGAELYLGKDMFSKGTKDLTRKKKCLTVQCKRFRKLGILPQFAGFWT
jgi:hypothetical protein